MTFGHHTAHTAAFTRTLDAAAREVATFQRRLITGFWAHYMGRQPPWPVAPKRGEPVGAWPRTRKRMAANRRQRKLTRRLHQQLRRRGRNKSGGRT